MIVTPETPQDITALVAANFRSFGGGRGSKYNPISEALKDSPASFAAGVDIQEVVDFILEQAARIPASNPSDFTEQTLQKEGWYFWYPQYASNGKVPQWLFVREEAITDGELKCKMYAGRYIGPYTPPADPLQK